MSELLKTLINAATYNDLEAARDALKNGVDPNGKGGLFEDETAITCAAWFGHTEMVRLLVSGGADIDGRNDNGETALLNAVGQENSELVSVLIELKADLDLKNGFEQSPLMVSVSLGNKEVLALLVSGGADLDEADNQGISPLLYAVHMLPDDVLSMHLIEAGANPNLKDKRGRTPLQIATRTSNYSLAECLVGAGADATLAAADGDSALKWATRHELNEFLELFAK